MQEPKYELYHWGIKDMKWGVRRYQNKDGSLTDAGKKRYDRDVRENNARKKDNRINIDGPDAKRWAREDLERTKRIVDTSSNIVREVSKAERETRPKSTRKSLDLSKMSDQDLRNSINRAQMEKQYQELFAPSEAPKISRGRKFTESVLPALETTLAVGSSALAIALAIKELRG